MKKKITTKNKYFKWNYSLILLILMLLPSMFILMQISSKQNIIINDTPVIQPAIKSTTLVPEDFLYYKDLTINQSKVVGGPHDNFPMLLKLYDPDLDEYAQPDGFDIVFYSMTDFQWLEHEIETYTQHYNSTHAELIAWIQVPSLSNSAPVVIRMYFGYKTSLDSEEDPIALWNSYKGVWHLSESPIGSGNVIMDSTSHNIDGNPDSGMTADDQVEGMIEGSIHFDGQTNDHIDFTSYDDTQNSITVSFWMKADSMEYMVLIDSFPDEIDPIIFPNPRGWSVRTDVGGQISFFIGSNRIYSSLSTPANSYTDDGSWAHVACTYDGHNTAIYINGINGVSGTSSHDLRSNDVSLRFGDALRVSTGYTFKGVLDEVHISDFARSGDWIATEYSNQNDPANFYSIGILHSTDVNGPDITILNPTWGETKEDPFSITASITDNEGYNPEDGDVIATIHDGINSLFSVNMIKTGTPNEWTFEWSNVTLPDYPVGNYYIDIMARDTSLNLNEQTVANWMITLIDTHAPTVIIDPSIPTGPYGQNQIYEEIQIKATITDTKSNIMEAIAMINATDSFNIRMNFNGEKWICTWNNLTKYTNGDYMIKIWAIDGEGNVNQQQSIVLTINNSPFAPGGDDGGPLMITIVLLVLIGSFGAVGTYGFVKMKNNRKTGPNLDYKISKLQAGIKDTKSSLKYAKSSFNELIPPPRDKILDKKTSKKIEKKKNELIEIPKMNKTGTTSKILAQHEIIKKELKEKSPNEKLELLKKIVDDKDKNY